MEYGYSLSADALGSTVVIIDGTSNSIVNRIEYDMLGNIKNQTTTPQVELLFRKRPYLSTAGLYINRSGLYFPQTGNEGVPILGDLLSGSGGSGGSSGGEPCERHDECPRDSWCIDGHCMSNEELMPDFGGPITSEQCSLDNAYALGYPAVHIKPWNIGNILHDPIDLGGFFSGIGTNVVTGFTIETIGSAGAQVGLLLLTFGASVLIGTALGNAGVLEPNWECDNL